MVEGLGRIGYDALNLGRGDLLLPPDLLRKLNAGAAFPLLSANIVDAAGQAPFKGWIVKKAGRLRVGIFGLSGNQPLGLPELPGRDLTVQDPVAGARAAVSGLRRDADLVIALSQLGLEGDVRLAREVPGNRHHPRRLHPPGHADTPHRGDDDDSPLGSEGDAARPARSADPSGPRRRVDRARRCPGRRGPRLRLDPRPLEHHPTRSPGPVRAAGAPPRGVALAQPRRAGARARPRPRAPPMSARRPAAPAIPRSCASGRRASTPRPWPRWSASGRS